MPIRESSSSSTISRQIILSLNGNFEQFLVLCGLETLAFATLLICLFQFGFVTLHKVLVSGEGEFEVIRSYRDLVNRGVVGKSRHKKSIINVNVGVFKCALYDANYAIKKAELATRIAKIESYWLDELDALSELGWEHL